MTIRNILLINPSGVAREGKSNTYNWIPIGIISMAAYLRDKGLKTDVIDLCVSSKEDFYKKMSDQRPDMVGIGCNTPTYKYAKELAEYIKKNFDIPIVFGGVHPSLKPDEVLASKLVDFVIKGEGEIALYELISSLNEGKKVNKLIQSEPILELDTLPFFAYDFLDMEKYVASSVDEVGFRSIEMFASRGCPYQCSFCAVNSVMGRKLRLYPPKRLVKEMIYLTNKYDAEGVWFKDSTFTANLKWVEEFCDEMELQHADMFWSANARVDNIIKGGRTFLKRMKATGLKRIWFGVESGSPVIMDKLKKNIDLKSILNVFDLCREEGIESAAFYMIGLPGETLEDIKKTFYLSLMLNADISHWHIFNPYPGSELHDEMLKKGMIKNEHYGDMTFHHIAIEGNGVLRREEIQQIFDGICDFYYNNGKDPFR